MTTLLGFDRQEVDSYGVLSRLSPSSENVSLSVQ